MQYTFKTSSDCSLVVNALYLAADQYEKYAKEATGHVSSIAEQFTRQAADARRIAEEMEE